jgi:hypothetical protein
MARKGLLTARFWYAFTNQLLIAAQRPTATRVAGFKHWLGLGYCVRKGEHGIRIWAPCPPGKATIERWQANGSNRAERPGTFFRMTAVFAQDQVDELPPPAEPVPIAPPIEDVAGDSLAAHIEPLVGLAAEIGSEVTIQPVPRGSGCYEVESKRIRIEENLSGNGRVKTRRRLLSGDRPQGVRPPAR